MCFKDANLKYHNIVYIIQATVAKKRCNMKSHALLACRQAGFDPQTGHVIF